MRSSDIPCHHTILTILRPLKITTILSRTILTDWEIKICYGRPCSINVGLKDIEKPTRGRLRWQEAANFGSCESNSDPGCKTLLSSHMSLHLPVSAPYRHMLWGCMRGCKTSLRLPPYMQSMAWWPWRPFCTDIPLSDFTQSTSQKCQNSWIPLSLRKKPKVVSASPQQLCFSGFGWQWFDAASESVLLWAVAGGPGWLFR